MKPTVVPDIDVRVVQLPPMRVVAVRAVSAQPERDAWARLKPWAEARGWLRDPTAHPVYGFNNPAPLPGWTAYGYELWIGAAPDTAPEENFEVKDFAGGCYAVTHCKLLGDPHGRVQDVWRALWESVQNGRYRWRYDQELERPVDPCARPEDMVLELYLPVEDLQPA